eukprot:scaffold101751_cov48-Prasinocladus_malaysianus.AAC.2
MNESMHRDEKMQLLRAQEEERRKTKEEAKLQIQKCKELSQTEFKQWQERHEQQQSKKHSRNLDFKRKMEKLLSDVRKILEDEHKEKEKMLQMQYERREQEFTRVQEELAEEVEDKIDKLGVLVSTERVQRTKVYILSWLVWDNDAYRWSFSDLMGALASQLTEMKDVLKESWKKDPDGHWAFSNPANLKSNINLRMKTVR